MKTFLKLFCMTVASKAHNQGGDIIRFSNPEHVLQYVYSGHAQGVCRVDDQETSFDLRPGFLLFKQPNQQLKYTVQSRDGMEMLTLHFDMEYHDECANLERDIPLVRDIGRTGLLVSLLDGLSASLGNSGWKNLEQAMSGLGNLLVGLLAEDVPFNPAVNQSKKEGLPTKLMQAIHYTHRAYRRGDMPTLTVRDLADAGGVTPVHLARLFQKYFELPPAECLRNLRLTTAQDLLLNTSLTQERIARACGYSISHFTKVFTEVVGTLPSAFRESGSKVQLFHPFDQKRYDFHYTLDGSFGEEATGRLTRALEQSHELWDDRVRPYALVENASSESFAHVPLQDVVNHPCNLKREAFVAGNQLSLLLKDGRLRHMHGVPFLLTGETVEGDDAEVPLMCLATTSTHPEFSFGKAASASLEVNQHAEALYFLHTAGYVSQEAAHFCSYEVHYASGETETVKLVSPGKKIILQSALPPTIQDWHPNAPILQTDWARPYLLCDSPSSIGQHQFLYTLEWRNPKPEDPIASILIQPKTDQPTTVLLFAVTALLPSIV